MKRLVQKKIGRTPLHRCGEWCRVRESVAFVRGDRQEFALKKKVGFFFKVMSPNFLTRFEMLFRVSRQPVFLPAKRPFVINVVAALTLDRTAAASSFTFRTCVIVCSLIGFTPRQVNRARAITSREVEIEANVAGEGG